MLRYTYLDIFMLYKQFRLMAHRFGVFSFSDMTSHAIERRTRHSVVLSDLADDSDWEQTQVSWQSQNQMIFCHQSLSN